MAEKQTFETMLEKHERMDATGITIPFDAETVYGAKRISVKVKNNGIERRSTIVRMSGKYMLGVPKELRHAAKINHGDLIVVLHEKDEEKRIVEVPEDLAQALKANDLTDAFAKLSFTARKEFVRAAEEAKREETRIRRIEKCMKMLAEEKKK